LTVLIGTYNMQTRVLRALKIDPEAHHKSFGDAHAEP
jgi:hypothetical protein